jgi:putative component of membrane protein insertase Oxa1/YidC/SpoIIIJ protein YidD
MEMIARALGVVAFLVASGFAQTSLEDLKWGAVEPEYAPERVRSEREYSFEFEGVLDALATTTIYGYRFFFSDVDGENCPFRPSCSQFFVEASRRYGVVHGGLMFADRFTRDATIVKSAAQYGAPEGGKYVDPPERYSAIEADALDSHERGRTR